MSNRLALETSPYLRQHADNPVDWYPWGPEALSTAKRDNKPIHLSIGYAACHWCHVMAHESFEDPEVARFMNDHFVNIKVDRQERPDLDDVYQKVVQMMGQGGGWPLTVFLTPSGEPFFGGTYFPPRDAFGRPSFIRVLHGLSEAWRNQRAGIEENVAQFRRGYDEMEARLYSGESPEDEDIPAAAANLFAENTDPVHGGLGGAPKFPNVSCHDLVLRIYERLREPALLRSLEKTLDKMASGGIYDHLGGGFSRYSVDESWSVPHFEKMLYDNGQLVKLYADAYRLTGKESYRRVFEDTIAYVLRDLSHPEGAFCASEDADSEGEEGRFYVWTKAEVEAALETDEAELACRAYGITEHGNFEHGTTVLHRPVELDEAERARLHVVRQKLLAVRARRVRPGRDENVLTNWNALMIQGLCAAYQATGHVAHLEHAKAAARFVRTHLVSADGGLFHVWNSGVAKVDGFLDDYAFLANALIDLYESSLDRSYLDWAIALVDRLLELFWDDGLYFTRGGGEALVHRPRVPHDNAWPSGTSTSVFALLRLHELTLEARYRERAVHVMETYAAAAVRNPFGFAHLLSAMDFQRRGPLSIVIAGERMDSTALVEAVHRVYLPARVLAHADDVPIGVDRTVIDGKPAAYVCHQHVCRTPVTSASALIDSCAA